MSMADYDNTIGLLSLRVLLFSDNSKSSSETNVFSLIVTFSMGEFAGTKNWIANLIVILFGVRVGIGSNSVVIL